LSTLNFTKLHGLGNDYLLIDAFDQEIVSPDELARAMSNRHFGVGSDGIILAAPSDTADVRMRMFNADGSEAEMCGNGIRCLAKFAWDRDLAKVNPMKIETLAGVLTLQLTLVDNTVVAAKADMGEPKLKPAEVPVNIPGEGPAVKHSFELEGSTANGTCVSMGNPHLIFFVEDVDEVELTTIGPKWENHPAFPNRVNVHYVQVLAPDKVKMRTWERGSGITLACGTGASAVCVAGVLESRTERKITAQLPGGNLDLEWDETSNHVFMTGPVVEVFTGSWQQKETHNPCQEK
jgi:diaminopimelate epimerase